MERKGEGRDGGGQGMGENVVEEKEWADEDRGVCGGGGANMRRDEMEPESSSFRLLLRPSLNLGLQLLETRRLPELGSVFCHGSTFSSLSFIKIKTIPSDSSGSASSRSPPPPRKLTKYLDHKG